MIGKGHETAFKDRQRVRPIARAQRHTTHVQRGIGHVDASADWEAQRNGVDGFSPMDKFWLHQLWWVLDMF
jgi:hypothetical protein